MRLQLVALLTIGVTPAFSFQSVHVVNGGTSSALQSAIDAAASGDTVLVHGGSFDAVAIQGKALTLVAEPALGTQVGALAIGALAANQRCVVAGLEIVPSPTSAAVTVIGCAGSVRLEGLRAVAGANTSSDGLIVVGSTDVACVASRLTAGSQIPTPGPNPTPSFAPGRGVVCQSSQLALYDSLIAGGGGQTDHFINTSFGSSGAGLGGAALEVDASSTVFASKTTFTGGAGGMGRALSCAHLPCGIVPSAGAGGGPGLFVTPGASVSTLDCIAQGGTGGAGGSGGQCCPQTTWPSGANGSAGAAEQGAVTHFAGAGTSLVAPSPVRAGTTLALSVLGAPGDTLFLAVSSRTRFALDPFRSGVFLFGPSVRRASFGLVPGSGVLSVSIPVGALPVGAQSAMRYLQVLARDPSGRLRLGSPAFLTVLDPAF